MEEQQNKNVSLVTETLGKILKRKLTIPEYQRTYCWEDKQVNTLLDDLRDFFTDKQGEDDVYVMSTVILHKRQAVSEEEYDIVDGQQRLITLALILFAINSKSNQDSKNKFWNPEECSLLKANFGRVK